MPPDTRTRAGSPLFPATQWTVVVAAGQNPSTESAVALEQLCSIYWYPLYAFIRRNGHSPSDAEDLTQEFFARFLSHGWVTDADRAKGRFRTYLLTALSRFLANERDRARAQKRGGKITVVPLDTAAAEGRLSVEEAMARPMSPDRLYDRQWAATLLEQVLARLEVEHRAAGKSAEFEVLSAHLTAERGAVPYDRLAHELGATDSAVRMTLHRLRKRFRSVFREEIARTVDGPEEVEAETRHLLEALAD